MILYHGSNVEIEEIDLSRSEVGKDFGVGFYLTTNRNQAEQMANRKARLYGGKPVVSIFKFEEDAAQSASLLQMMTLVSKFVAFWLASSLSTYFWKS